MFARLMAALGYVPKSDYDELYRNSQALLCEYRIFRESYKHWLVKYNATSQPPKVPVDFSNNIIPFRGRS